MESKQAQMTVSASLTYGRAETLKPSTSCWSWFSVNPQPAFGPHRCPFSPQWVVPAGNCRHKWSHLAECLTAKSHQENKLNVQTLHGYASLHAHLIPAHTPGQKCRCNNSAVFKSLAMDCSEMPWADSLFSGYLTCSYQQPRIYLSISVVPCLCGNTENHKESGTDTNRDGPGHCQGPTQGRRARRQAGLVIGSPKKSPTGKSGTPMVFICHQRQKQSVRINRNGLVSKMENWITGCQEVAGHGDGCKCHCKDLISSMLENDWLV